MSHKPHKGDTKGPWWMSGNAVGCTRGKNHGAGEILCIVSESQPALCLGETLPLLQGCLLQIQVWKMAPGKKGQRFAFMAYPAGTCRDTQGPWQIPLHPSAQNLGRTWVFTQSVPLHQLLWLVWPENLTLDSHRSLWNLFVNGDTGTSPYRIVGRTGEKACGALGTVLSTQ